MRDQTQYPADHFPLELDNLPLYSKQDQQTVKIASLLFHKSRFYQSVIRSQTVFLNHQEGIHEMLAVICHQQTSQR